MPDNSDGNRQERPNASPDSGNGQEPATSQVSSDKRDSGSPQATMTLEDALGALETARKDAAKARTDAKRLAELEKRFQDEENAKLSEQERAEKERAAYQQKLADLEREKQEYAVRGDIKVAAAELGLSAKLARLIIPWEAIEFDESGDPTNVVELLRAAAQEHEIAVKDKDSAATPAAQQPSRVTSGGAVNPGRTATSSNGLFDGDPQTVMARISHLSPSEYAARGAEIQRYIAANWSRISGR